MKSDKILLVIIIVTIISIIVIASLIYIINKNNKMDKDEIWNQAEAGVEYSTDHLKNFEFKVINVDNKVKNLIPQYDMFTFKMKEYLYLNGLVQASTAEFVDFESNDNNIIIKFKLNNPKQTIVTAKINLQDNTYIFSDNYNI